MRLLTLNLWNEQGPWRRRLELLVERLPELAPDVICLQEVRERPAAGDDSGVPNQARWLADQCGGWHCAFAGAQPWGGGVEGLAVLSRWPIEREEIGRLPGRASNQRLCLAAALTSPGQPIWVATTHLAYRLRDGQLREQQVEALDTFVQRLRSAGQTTVVAGDFNAVPEADEIRFMGGLHGVMGRRTYWQDAWARCHPGDPGWTWCAENPYTDALDFFPRDRRLDYIFVSPQTRQGHARIRSCEIVLERPDRSGVYVSDHWGLLAELDT
jgi:endonuclease/exonuclease/phosphatase family metal-dependent hydrolase